MTEWLRRRSAEPTPPPAKSTSSSSYSGPPTPKILSGGSWKPPPPIFYKPPLPVRSTGSAPSRVYRSEEELAERDAEEATDMRAAISAADRLIVAAPNPMHTYVISSVGRTVAKTKAPSKSVPPLGPPAASGRGRPSETSLERFLLLVAFSGRRSGPLR